MPMTTQAREILAALRLENVRYAIRDLAVLADEARAEGFVFADRTAWKLCSANGWFSVFGKKTSRKKSKSGSRGTVIKQSKKPKSVLPAGSKVNVMLRK